MRTILFGRTINKSLIIVVYITNNLANALYLFLEYSLFYDEDFKSINRNIRFNKLID